MYYRRKILLAVLETFGGQLPKTDLQKYLFLFSQKQKSPAYEFYPYKFGCYSAVATQDLGTLKKYGAVLEKTAGWALNSENSFIKALKKDDQALLREFASEFQNLSGKELIRFVYRNYPFYAIRSEIAEEILSSIDKQKVENARPHHTTQAIFTIGYEGKTIERYVRELMENSIQVLCDVRKNPLSMKFGFSKKQLKGIVESVGIEYVHFPGLGISSNKRQDLSSKSAYDQLFVEYNKTTLKENHWDIDSIRTLIEKRNRIALTCFESDFTCCHRSHTAKALLESLSKPIPVTHL